MSMLLLQNLQFQCDNMYRDGGYTEWSSFTPCSLSCGEGRRSRIRYCKQPTPSWGGKHCNVIGKEFVIVNNQHLRVVENTAMLSVRDLSTFNWYKMLILGKFCLKKKILKCLRRTVNFYKIR